MLIKIGLYVFAAFLVVPIASARASDVSISSYGAIADDGKDDTSAINAAVEAAKPGDSITFDVGTYDLSDPLNERQFLRIQNKQNLTLRGAVVDGEPATTLLRHVELLNRGKLPHTIWNQDNQNITLENFVLDNSSRFCTAGQVVAKDPEGTWVRVKIFDGLPMDAETGCYAANAWENTSPPVLKKVSSLTFGNREGTWVIKNQSSRIMQLTSDEGRLRFIDWIEVGELMSWHYGTAGPNQMTSKNVDGLTLRNLRIPSAINAWTLIAFCNDVTLERIRVAPDSGQLAVGARDAFHISRCTGDLKIDDVDIEGVRMDPIVIRGAYASIHSKSDPTHFRIAIKAAAQPIPAGSKLGLWRESGQVEFVTVQSAQWGTQPVRGYTIVTEVAIPEWADVGTELKIGAHLPKSISISNCDFRNNAACDVILFADDALLSNNTHLRSMFPAICMGSNNSTAGVCGSNIKILDSIFRDCGWERKNGVIGTITMKNNNKFATAKLSDVQIKNNKFSGIEDGPSIYVADVEHCEISGNSFTDVLASVHVDQRTSAEVDVHDNTGMTKQLQTIDSSEITATASDSYPGRGPIFAIDQSGMIANAHDARKMDGSMWMSKGGRMPKWFKVDLGRPHEGLGMLIYNFNAKGYTNRGCKKVQIYYSDSDRDPGNPVNDIGKWKKAGRPFTLPQATGKSDYGNSKKTRPRRVKLPSRVRWVSLRIDSDWGGKSCGLSEIRFFAL